MEPIRSRNTAVLDNEMGKLVRENFTFRCVGQLLVYLNFITQIGSKDAPAHRERSLGNFHNAKVPSETHKVCRNRFASGLQDSKPNHSPFLSYGGPPAALTMTDAVE